MLARERANWFDTEGNLYVSPLTTPLSDSVAGICIAQTDRTPLDAFAKGCAIDGVASRVERKLDNREGYRLAIDRIEDMTKELTLEIPHIRSRRKMDEVRTFLAYLERPRIVERDSIRRAREMVSKWNLPATPLRRVMDPLDRANWHETEGCLSVGPHAFLSKSGGEFLVSQFEKEPLQDFVAGCAKDGVSCSIYHREVETGTEHFARIRRLDQIAFELSLEIPFFRLRKTMNQVKTFIDYIWMPRKRFSNSLEVARKVLGRGPVV
jgi:hypothetical protein